DGGRAGSGQGDRGRHAEPHEHPAVDPAQERGGALGGQGPGGGEGGSRRHLKFVHGGTPPEVRILSGMKTGAGGGGVPGGRALQFTCRRSLCSAASAMGSPGFSRSAPSNSASASAIWPRAARSRPRFR